jgi:uncharacterized protein
MRSPVPSFPHVLLIASLLLSAVPATADVAADYKAGFTAYQAGDMVGALESLRRAAEAGHGPAQVLLADVLDKSEFNEESVAWYRKAAAQGDPDGEYGLASMISSGEGVARDLVEAKKWYMRAAEHGHVLAIKVLAHAYLTGDLALDEAAREGAEALAAMVKAAEKDYLPAIDALAKAYVSGRWGLIPDSGKVEHYQKRASQLRGRPNNSGPNKGKR